MCFTVRVLLALIAALHVMALGGCDAGELARTGNYTITVATGNDSRFAVFAGTYQFFESGRRVTRDLSGHGTVSVNFYADDLAFVRVHGSSQDGVYSLKISRDGEILYESPVISANNPIFYTPGSGGTQ